MAEIVEKDESILSDQSKITVTTCDDEGYETAGKKTIAIRPKSTSKDGRKPHEDECSADDDGYETAGKKELVAQPRVKSGDKQGRKTRGGSVSPRPENRDRTHLSSEADIKHKADDRVQHLVESMEGVVTVDQLKDTAVELLKLIPEGYIPLPHQVGGHRHIDGKVGFLRSIGKPHLLYKPMQEGAKGQREVSFYDSMFSVTTPLGTPKEMFPSVCDGIEHAQSMLPLIPAYHGMVKITDRAGKIYDYIVLEDVTHRFTHPCIMDVKLGRRVWDDFADRDKIERELKKYPAQERIGFRIIGMRTYVATKDKYVYYDRQFGLSVTENNAKNAIMCFFKVGDGTYRTDMIKRIYSKLTEILSWMDRQDTLRLFATSLLIVYEGGPTPPTSAQLDIRLVDFAHCYECTDTSRPDGNSVFGVRAFMNYLAEIEKECSSC